MRASFVFSEVVNGLRRNITMTIAMVLTTAISLTMLGGGLLIVRTIDKTQLIYSDKVEVMVSLTDDISANDKNCTSQICSDLRKQLENTDNVESVVFENRDQTYKRFQQAFSSQPELLKLTRPESLPATFLLKLKDTTKSQAIIDAYSTKPGVQSVDDQNQYVKDFFDQLNSIRNGTFVAASLIALAALLLISNMIQISAFTRRAEVGIMRLVGATRWYTQLPFLIEAVVAGVIGAVLSVVGTALFKTVLLDNVLAQPIKSNIVAKLDMLDVLAISPILLLVSIAISTITGYVTLRLYVRL